ncbi:MAG TPA: TonB-dependent receptor [Bryobacteraceae bacterium]|nr:TonB-dependent receptor [Bryobacteraceae bacterium]
MEEKIPLHWACEIVVAAVFLVCPLLAQVDRAALKGRVTEVGGPGIPGVSVAVRSLANGSERTGKTDAGGFYLLAGLPIGRYSVTFSSPSLQVLLVELGYKTRRFDNVELFIGGNRSLDVQMEVGIEDTEAPAEKSGGRVEHSTAELGRVIQPEQVLGIPLNGRNWAGLMVLAPGSVNTGQGNQESIRFIGRSTDDNNWTLDGIDSTGINKPRQEGSLRLIISSDAIAEFRVNTTLYSVESGTGHGAQIDVVSKSGSNDFHGGLFEFFRDDKLEARKPFDTAHPPFRLNQFGGSLGGPIRHNRSFFYANYEGLRQDLTQTLAGLVPSAAFRTEVLSLSPALRPVIEAYPIGRQGTADPKVDDYSVQANQTWREDSALLRLDHRWSSQTSGFTRYNLDNAQIVEPLNALLDRRTSRFRTSNFASQVEHVFSPHVTAEGRLGMNRAVLHRSVAALFHEGFSIPGLTSIGNTVNCAVCTNSQSVDAGTSYSLLQNLAVTHGRHSWKVGGEFRRIQLNVGNSAAVSAAYASLESFARNRLDNVAINGELATRGSRRSYYLPFIQDEVKLRPNLTLTAGVRYEYYTVLKEVLDRARVFNLYTCSGFCPPGSPFYLPDRNNFDPRVGLSWSPALFQNRTVIRSGFGVYHGTGENGDLNAAVTSSAERFSLSAVEFPRLSFPVTPFLGIARAIGSTPRSLQRDRRDPYSEQWGLSIEQELPHSFFGEARYVGTSAHKLFSRAFVNVIDPATRRRPLPEFGKIDEKRNVGNSSFNALILSIRRPFAKGLLWETQYMWSHSINDNSIGGGEAGQPENTNCRRCERGNSNFDIRHTLTTSLIHQLPSLRSGWSVGRRLLSNWDVSGLATARTGSPITVVVSRSSASLPDGNNSNQRPDLRMGISLYPPGGPTPGLWINAAAFSVPAAGAWGNAGRNLLRGPNLWEANLALSRKAQISDRWSLHFRTEIFNLFNRNQLANPLADLANPGSFGRIIAPLNSAATGLGVPRQIQLVLRIER